MSRYRTRPHHWFIVLGCIALLILSIWHLSGTAR